MASLERRIAALAFPALIVLAAEPLYLLFDIAVVGRLGALSLAGLAIGGLIVSLVGSQLTFLSTATTARSARFYGVGNRAAAVAEGVQATWLAIGLGLAVVVVVQLAAVLGVIVLGRFLAYPLMRFVGAMQVRELFTGFALLLVLGVAALMERVGLSMGLGAFLAGVLLGFARALGEFGATLMVAGSIPGKTQTLSIAIYEAVQAGQDDIANTLVLITSLVCIAVLLGAGRLAPGRIAHRA